ncbi:hypothetical protein CEP87_08550 [Psychrobacter cryohalolentis]|nr:hypothetical protein CEP87_08550 [Psychrobacter cryohalolentis]
MQKIAIKNSDKKQISLIKVAKYATSRIKIARLEKYTLGINDTYIEGMTTWLKNAKLSVIIRSILNWVCHD